MLPSELVRSWRGSALALVRPPPQLSRGTRWGAVFAFALTTPRRMTLEKAIAYISDDELVEVTPESIRLRKRYLDPHERKRHARSADVA